MVWDYETHKYILLRKETKKKLETMKKQGQFRSYDELVNDMILYFEEIGL